MNFTSGFKAVSVGFAFHVEVDEKIRRRGFSPQLAKKIRQLAAMITTVIHEVLHHSPERVLVRLALRIHVLEWRLQSGLGDVGAEGPEGLNTVHRQGGLIGPGNVLIRFDQDHAFDFWPTPPALPPVKVAVIDSGIDATHPDLVPRILLAKSFIGGTPADANGHGTFMAGLTSLVVGLLPIRELDGSTLKSWSTAGWVAVYLVGVYAYAVMQGGATSKVVVLSRTHINRAKAKSDGADSEYWKFVRNQSWRARALS